MNSVLDDLYLLYVSAVSPFNSSPTLLPKKFSTSGFNESFKIDVADIEVNLQVQNQKKNRKRKATINNPNSKRKEILHQNWEYTLIQVEEQPNSFRKPESRIIRNGALRETNLCFYYSCSYLSPPYYRTPPMSSLVTALNGLLH